MLQPREIAIARTATEKFLGKIHCRSCLTHKPADQIRKRKATGKAICTTCLEAMRKANREKLCQTNK